MSQYGSATPNAVLSATVNDIADAVRKARPLDNPVSHEEWNRRRAITLNAGMTAIAWALKLKEKTCKHLCVQTRISHR